MSNPLYDRLFAPLAERRSTLLILDDGSEIAGSELLAAIHRSAQALLADGVRPGDRVAAQVAKTPQALALYAATVAVGAVFLPLNTAYTAAEVDYFVGDAAPALLLADPAKSEALAPIAAKHGAILRTLGADGNGSFRALADRQSEAFVPVARGEDDLAALLYTSGTTGRSKGAMISHANLASNAVTLVDYWRFSRDDVLLHALPIFHIHGLFVATNVTLMAGAGMIFCKFDGDELMRLMPRATVMMGVPTFYVRLLQHKGLTKEATAHMRLFVSGSAPLLAETHVAWEERTGHRILERYGMTETNMLTSNPLDGPRRGGSVGLPLPGVEVRVVDPAGDSLPEGSVGEIEVRGPNVFRGYWRNPEKTRGEFRADGFFRTGDVGRLDADGYLSIVGRSKDLIISGGLNVYPKEVESVIDEMPGIGESAVVGVEHPDFGEAVVAVVTCRPDADPASGAAVIAHARERLAAFKVPKAVFIVDQLPRNVMGKVEKNKLRAQYRDIFR